MDAALEDALVNWYEVERSARWWANHSRCGEVVCIDTARPKPSAALDGLFRAVEDALKGRFPSAAMYRDERTADADQDEPDQDGRYASRHG